MDRRYGVQTPDVVAMLQEQQQLLKNLIHTQESMKETQETMKLPFSTSYQHFKNKEQTSLVRHQRLTVQSDSGINGLSMCTRYQYFYIQRKRLRQFMMHWFRPSERYKFVLVWCGTTFLLCVVCANVMQPRSQPSKYICYF